MLTHLIIKSLLKHILQNFFLIRSLYKMKSNILMNDCESCYDPDFSEKKRNIILDAYGSYTYTCVRMTHMYSSVSMPRHLYHILITVRLHYHVRLKKKVLSLKLREKNQHFPFVH